MLKYKLVWHIAEQNREPQWLSPGDSVAFYTCYKSQEDWTLDVSMGNTVHELWAPTAQAGRDMAEAIEKALLQKFLRPSNTP